MKTIQLHNPEMVKQGQKMSTQQIAQFLEDFRLLHGSVKQQKSKLISLKVQPSLLTAFRFKCEQQNLKYQTQIKTLMTDWLKSS